MEYDGVDDNAQKIELEVYLDEARYIENRGSGTFDILSFWKGNEFRDVLSIPISTVASESCFSTGGRVIDQYRSLLKPDIVEALICTKDWLYGQQGNIRLLVICIFNFFIYFFFFFYLTLITLISLIF
jgi:hypothetical protein